jgi:AraC-like DNA-binding protein
MAADARGGDEPMLSLELGHIPAGESLAGHGHAAPHLLIVTGGSLAEHDAGRTQDLSSGSFRLSPSGARHDLCFGSDGADCLVVEAEGEFWRRLFCRALAGRDGNYFGAADGAHIIAETCDVARLARSREHVAALGRVLAAAAARRPIDQPPVWMEEALALIESGAERAIAGVADALRRDRIHFTRAFGEWLGYRPAEYRALRRASSALELIRNTDGPLAEIAVECGYAHQSHMNRELRSVFGRTPSHWRS